jgi:hypothetical protein
MPENSCPLSNGGVIIKQVRRFFIYFREYFFLIAWTSAIFLHLASKPTASTSDASVADFQYPLLWVTPSVQVLLLAGSWLIVVGSITPTFASRLSHERVMESRSRGECVTCNHPALPMSNHSDICSECGHPVGQPIFFRTRARLTRLTLILAGLILMTTPIMMPRIYLASQGSIVSKMIDRADAYSQYVTWILFGNHRIVDQTHGWS